MLDGKFDEEEHHRLQGGDGNIAGALRRGVLVQQGQTGRRLVDADELVGAFEDIFGFLMRWRRLLQELARRKKMNKKKPRKAKTRFYFVIDFTEKSARLLPSTYLSLFPSLPLL